MFSLIALLLQQLTSMHTEVTLFSRDPSWSPINGCGYKAVRLNEGKAINVGSRPGI